MTVLDKSSDAINVIRNYDDMKLIICKTPYEITEQYDKLESPSSFKIDGMPKSRKSDAMEEMWTAGFDTLNLIRKRYHEAKAFIMWFEPMWLTFTEEEREILETYKWSDKRSGTGKQLAEELNYSHRNLNNIRQKALKRLSKLLYGN